MNRNIHDYGMTRSEHMDWAKKRALEYIDRAEKAGPPESKALIQEAFSSIASDLKKHKETADHVGLLLGMMQLMSGQLSTAHEMRHFIEGFN